MAINIKIGIIVGFLTFSIINSNCYGFNDGDKKCNSVGGYCDPGLGICKCYQYYTGSNCDNYYKPNINYVNGQVGSATLFGVVFFWLIAFPLIIYGVILNRYFFYLSISEIMSISYGKIIFLII